MTTSTHSALSTPLWTDRDLAVVVGVDGSDANRAAVRWATEEAAEAKRPLTLLSVSGDFGSLREPAEWASHEQEETIAHLREIAEKIHDEHPGLVTRREYEVGHPVPTLLRASAGQGVLVVGRRGLGTFGRMLVGSTSIGVAGRATIPVVIVPDEWDAEASRGKSVVVGVDAEDLNDHALHYAFSQAERHGVPLVPVYAPHVRNTMVWDVALYVDMHDQWQAEGRQELEDVLAPFRAAFPTVEVQPQVPLMHPGDLMLQNEKDAQLLVLGRKHDGHFGFAFGSISRGVLHYATTPVAVVPSA